MDVDFGFRPHLLNINGNVLHGVPGQMCMVNPKLHNVELRLTASGNIQQLGWGPVTDVSKTLT